MSLRHKAYKATLDKGYASEWNDDHRANFEDEVLGYWTFSSTNIPAEFSEVETNNGTVTVGMTDNHNFCVLTSSVTAGGLAALVLGTDDVTNKLDLPEFNTAVQLATTAQHEFGFFTYAGVPFTANQNGAYFRVASNVLYAVTGSGAAETTTNLGPPNEYDIYRIEFTSTHVKFYVGATSTASADHTANIPSVDLTLKLASKVSGGVSQIMRIDGLALQRLRKQ